MYETQLLKVRIRPGMTERVIEFLRSLRERKDAALEAMRREGVTVESLFLERRDEGDYLYYYVKAKDLAHANDVNLQATDSLTLEIRAFISETWGEIASPEPLLDLDLIAPAASKSLAPGKPKRRAEGRSAASPSSPRILAGG